jgi:ACR3 family arsenite efflux pump ArsB
MQRPLLERAQPGVYLLVIISRALLGAALPGASPWFELRLWPTLASLLYTMFTQIPLLHLRQVWRQPRPLLIILGANFLAVPLVVGFSGVGFSDTSSRHMRHPRHWDAQLPPLHRRFRGGQNM